MNWQYLTLLVLGLVCTTSYAQETQKLRTVVLTDMTENSGNQHSLRRLLTYSNQWNIEGIIATTSVHEKSKVEIGKIREIVTFYNQLQPNLAKHEDGFPTGDILQQKIKAGFEGYGMKGIGKGKNSEGSDWIVQLLENSDEPLWVQVWGDANCIAQALWQIKATKSEAVATSLYQKVRIFSVIGDDEAGEWIQKNFSNIFYISALPKTSNHPMNQSEPMADLSNAIDVSKKNNHATLIHSTNPNQMPKEGLWKGGNLSILYLLSNGLNSPENPNFGSWGGRYNVDNQGILGFANVSSKWVNSDDKLEATIENNHQEQNDMTMWATNIQNDFIARTEWTKKPFHETNHPPIPGLTHDEILNVTSGDIVELNATNSMDYDGNEIYFEWSQYHEASTCKKPIEIEKPKRATISIVMPYIDEPATAHIILKLTDSGTPALTRYKRIILNIQPD